MRLENLDGHYIATVEPLLPLEPGEVVAWGERVFRQVGPDTWQETLVTVVTVGRGNG